MPTLMGFDSDDERSFGEVGREGVAVDHVDDVHGIFDGIDIGSISVSMTINPTAWILLGDVPRRRRRAWHPARAAVGHDAGGHREGVHRPEGVDLPRRALASHLSRHDHVRRPRASAVEPDQHLRLPRPRGRLHRRAGGRLHARRRDRLRGARDGDRHGLRRVRAALLVLLHRALRLPRGSGEVPGGTAAVGEDRARPLRRAQAGVDAPALPLPDLGLLADRSPAAQQRRPRSPPGARRCLRRRAVACT